MNQVLKSLAILAFGMGLTACYNGSSSSTSATNNATVVAQNANGQTVSSVMIVPNATTVIRLHNSSNYAVANPVLTLPTLTGVTSSGSCPTLAAGENCDISFTAGASPSGSGALTLKGDNLASPVSLSVQTNSSGVIFSAVPENEQPTTLRGLKYAQVKMANQSGQNITLQGLTSTLSNVALATDTAHAPSGNCALNGSLPSGSSCAFWVVSSNGSDVGTQTGTLSISYLMNGNSNLQTQDINASVETDLYMAGGFTTNGQCHNASTTGTCINLAKWDGTQWNAVGGNFAFGTESNPINDITTDPNGNIDLFLGQPVSISSVTLNYLGSWDGVSWNNLGGGVTPNETTLQGSQRQQFFAWDDTTDPSAPVLYFYYVSAAPNNKWTLGSWSPTANGGIGVLNANIYEFTGTNPSLNGLVFANGKLYVTDINNDTGNGTVDFANVSDLTSWSALSTTGFNSFYPVNMLINNDVLYTGGGFESASGGKVYVLSTYDLTGTGPFNPYYLTGDADDDFSNAAYPQGISNNTFYFTADNFAGNARVLSAPTNNLSSYTEIGVSNTTGKSITGTKAVVITSSGALYAAGGFDGMNGTSSNCIAKESGGTWSALLGATNGITTVCQGGQAPLGLILAPTLSLQ